MTGMIPPGLDLTPAVLSVVAQQLALMAVMIAGFLLIVGAWRWATRAFLLAILFVVVAVVGPGWLP